MKSRALGLLPLAIALSIGCSNRNGEPAENPWPLMGETADLKTRAAALGCTQVFPQPGLIGREKFACQIALGPCGCRLRVNVSSEERKGKSFVFHVLMDIESCAENVGLQEVHQLAEPFVPDAEHARFREFTRRARLERTDGERKTFGVRQHDMFGVVHVQAEFDAESERPTRHFSFDTIKFDPSTTLVKKGLQGQSPCDVGSANESGR